MKYHTEPHKDYVPVTKPECKYFLAKYCYTINLPCNTGNCARVKRMNSEKK